jgi:predicted DNA-binding protein
MIDKEKIEKAIENITGLLMDFSEAADSLREVREILYSVLEAEEIRKHIEHCKPL